MRSLARPANDSSSRCYAVNAHKSKEVKVIRLGMSVKGAWGKSRGFTSQAKVDSYSVGLRIGSDGGVSSFNAFPLKNGWQISHGRVAWNASRFIVRLP
jgi:hypothetical protein